MSIKVQRIETVYFYPSLHPVEFMGGGSKDADGFQFIPINCVPVALCSSPKLDHESLDT